MGVEGRLNLEDTEYKNTQKLTWLAETVDFTPTVCVHFENIITKGVLKPEDDFKDFVNYNSKVRLCNVFIGVCVCVCVRMCTCMCVCFVH